MILVKIAGFTGFQDFPPLTLYLPFLSFLFLYSLPCPFWVSSSHVPFPHFLCSVLYLFSLLSAALIFPFLPFPISLLPHPRLDLPFCISSGIIHVLPVLEQPGDTQVFQFYDAKDLYKIRMGSAPTGMHSAGVVGKNKTAFYKCLRSLRLRCLNAENVYPFAMVVLVHDGGVICRVINSVGSSRQQLITVAFQLTSTRLVLCKSVDVFRGTACLL